MVYDPRRWALVFEDDPRAPALREWLEANGVSPHDVPVGYVVRVQEFEEGAFVCCVQFVREEGRVCVLGDAPVFQAVCVPLRVPVPAELLGKG